MPTNASTSRTERNAIEYAAAFSALLAAVLLCVLLARGGVLFTQSAWLDEYHTLFLAGIGSVGESMSALRRGADFNPPLLPLVMRGAGGLTWGVDLTGNHLLNLRVVTFAGVILALLGVYVLLRRQFGRVPSFLGAFALWFHPLVVRHAFELRFYGLWLLALTWFIVVLTVETRRHVVARRLLVALLAVALCLVHYFAVFTWGLVVGAFLWRTRRNESRFPAGDMAAAAMGPLALVACVPLYLGQRAALSRDTWVEPVTVSSVAIFLAIVVAGLPLIAGLLHVAPKLHLLPSATTEKHMRMRDVWNDPAMFALLTLFLLPLVLIVFSLVVQPSLISRYAITSVLAWPPLIALGASRVHERLLPAVGALLVAAGTLTTTVMARNSASIQGEMLLLRSAMSARVTAGALVVVADRVDLYPLARSGAAPGGAILVYPELPDSMTAGAKAIEIIERDVARTQNTLYGFPALRPIPDIRAEREFWMVTRTDSSTLPERWFPGHHAERVAPRLIRMTRVASAHVPEAT